MTLKIAEINHNYSLFGGGIRTYTDFKLKYAKLLGCAYSLIAPGPQTKVEIISEYARIYWIKSPITLLSRKYHYFNRFDLIGEIIKAVKPNLIEISSLKNLDKIQPLLSAMEIPYTHTFYEDTPSVYLENLLDKIFKYKTIDNIFEPPIWHYIRKRSKKLDSIISISHSTLARLERNRIDNSYYCPLGIDKKIFNPSAKNQTLRKTLLEKHGLDENALIFINVGRFHPEKRQLFLIQVMQELSKEIPLIFIILGEGPLDYFIRRVAKQSGCTHIIDYTRNTCDISKLLASSDIYLQGSISETYGLSVAEAICCGLPVVSPSRGATLDLLNKSYSEQYTPNDKLDCLKAIKKILSGDLNQKQKNAKECGNKLILDAETSVHNLFTYYAKLVK